MDEKTEKAILSLINTVDKQNKRFYNIIMALVIVIPICVLGILSILYFSDYKGSSVEQTQSDKTITQKIN